MQNYTFAESLMQQVAEKKNALCVGLDPHLQHIPVCFRDGGMEPNEARTVKSLENFLVSVIDRISGQVAVVKPQISFFELLGAPGFELLDRICRRAQQSGMKVILDAKRGDIGSTCDAYAQVYLGENSPYDALTVNPYMGLESLSPFVEQCMKNNKGLFVLVKTSNPGSKEFQELQVNGQTVYQIVAQELNKLVDDKAKPGETWSNFGAVVGATYPQQAAELRQLLPRSLFLIPGYGAQGGTLADAVCGLKHDANGLSGGIINSSRGVLFPTAIANADAREWESGFDANLQAICQEFSQYF